MPVEIARQVAVGVPHQTILETAAAEQVDWIVMATHGRTGLSHLVMGSVAERVVRTAPCPVLTLRPALGKADVSHTIQHWRKDRQDAPMPAESNHVSTARRRSGFW